jgi:hypothetical protein
MALPLIRIAAAAAAGYYFYNRNRRTRNRRLTGEHGSNTNASDAVDDINLKPNASHDEVVDAGVQETFPASDPVSVKPSETAYEREQRKRGGG